MPIIRESTPADDPAVTAIHALISPHRLDDPTARAHNRAIEPDLGRELLSEVDGRVVAVASMRPNMWSTRESETRFRIAVLPEFRRRGIGSTMLQQIEAYHREVGGTELSTGATEPDGIAYARKRGFTPGRRASLSRCDLTRLPPRIPVPEGVRVVPLCEVDDLRAVYATDSLAIVDIPNDVPMKSPTYEKWLAHLGDPRTDTASSVIAYEGDTVVALAYLHRVDTRVGSPFTATHPAHRGRGYAMLVKSHSLHAVADAGALTAYTSNDAENAPMLAVNHRLGYREYVEQVGLTRAES